MKIGAFVETDSRRKTVIQRRERRTHVTVKAQVNDNARKLTANGSTKIREQRR